MNAPAPGTPEWARLVTASKVAAILGLSPWDSPRSMWHKMKGELGDDGNNAEAKARGHYLEAGILAWWRDRHPEATGLVEQDWSEREGWAASTPDLSVKDDGYGNRAVVDAKTAASDDDWGDEPPAYYIAAAMWQMFTHDADIAYVAVLFGLPRLAFQEYVVQRDDALIAAIVAKCKAFYDSLTSDVPPELDDHPATYEAIRKLHPDINRDAATELTEAEAREYVEADIAFKAAETRAKAAKAAVLDRMGNARTATHNTQTIARRQPNKYGISLVRVATTVTSQEEDAA